MDVSAISNLIGSLGFPIIMCIMMFHKIDKQDIQHQEELSKITESLNNNTLAITKLVSRIDAKGEKDEQQIS